MKPDMSNFWKYDDATKRAELKAEPICKQGKICLTLLVFQIFFGGIAGSLGLGAFSSWAAQVTMAGFVLIFVGGLSLIRVDGKQIGNVAADGAFVPWKAIIFISVTFIFSSSIASADFGLVSTLMQILSPIAAKLPVAVLILTGALLCVVFTNLMSNVVTCFIMLSVFIPILSSVGVGNALLSATGALYIALCSLACATPSGSPGIGLVLGIEIENKEIVKHSLIYLVITMTVMVAVVLPLGSILY
jgi:di/tricarboxylate transporter